MEYQDAFDKNTCWEYDKELVLTNEDCGRELTAIFKREIDKAAKGNYKELIMTVPAVFLYYTSGAIGEGKERKYITFDTLSAIIQDSPFQEIVLIVHDHDARVAPAEKLLQLNPKVKILYTYEIISKFILVNGTDGFGFIAETLPFGVDQLYTYELPSDYVKKLYKPMRLMIDKHALEHTHEIAAEFQYCTDRW